MFMSIFIVHKISVQYNIRFIYTFRVEIISFNCQLLSRIEDLGRMCLCMVLNAAKLCNGLSFVQNEQIIIYTSLMEALRKF